MPEELIGDGAVVGAVEAEVELEEELEEERANMRFANPPQGVKGTWPSEDDGEMTELRVERFLGKLPIGGGDDDDDCRCSCCCCCNGNCI